MIMCYHLKIFQIFIENILLRTMVKASICSEQVSTLEDLIIFIIVKEGK